MSSARRVGAMVLRYVYLHKRSLPRSLEIVFWPVMELFVWGFVATHIQDLAGDRLAAMAFSLINAMIFWDLLYRSQQGVSVSIVEDIWTQNIVNLLVSPLKIWEWMLATFLYGTLKTAVIVLILTALALGMYRFDLVSTLHFYLIPLGASLLLFGWALGLFTSALVIRWGHAAEALIWGVPFLIQPFSAIFYPVSALPDWLKPVALSLPSTYIFEGMREVIRTGSMPLKNIGISFALDLVYFAAAALFFGWMHRQARRTGRLGRLGVD